MVSNRIVSASLAEMLSMAAMVTHRMIEAFHAVVQGGGVTRAAELLNVSQPSVSRLISDLETRIGLRLFERRGARLRATPAGLELFDEVERSFLALGRVEQAAAVIRDRAAGALAVAAMSALGYSLLPGLLAELRKAGAPPVRLHVVPSQVALGMLASRQVDVAFSTIPPAAAIGRPVGHYALEAQAILPPGHPLAAAAGPVEAAELAAFPMVALSTGSLARADTDRAFAALGIHPTIAVETMQAHSAAQLVGAGIGFAIVDPMTASTYRATGGRVRPFRPRLDVSFSAYSWHEPGEMPWTTRLVQMVTEAIGRAHEVSPGPSMPAA